MEAKNIFKNISPLDHRYYPANRELFENIEKNLSEEAAIRYSVKVEAALLGAYIRLLKDSDGSLLEEIEDFEDKIDPQDVYEEEEKTHHNIRALVKEVLKKHDAAWSAIGDRLRRLTGVDPESFFEKPWSYSGIAARKARQTPAICRGKTNTLKKELS
jgi:hypothetical protein